MSVHSLLRVPSAQPRHTLWPQATGIKRPEDCPRKGLQTLLLFLYDFIAPVLSFFKVGVSLSGCCFSLDDTGFVVFCSFLLC